MGPLSLDGLQENALLLLCSVPISTCLSNTPGSLQVPPTSSFPARIGPTSTCAKVIEATANRTNPSSCASNLGSEKTPPATT